MDKQFIGAAGTLIGLTIGAGVLGIPYVVAKAGFLTGIVMIVLLGLVVLLMNLYVGEIALRTKGIHQLPGYIGKYLGKKAKVLMTVSFAVLAYGALSAYLLAEGQVWGAIFGIQPIYPMLIFFVIMAVAIWKGLQLIEWLEVCLNCFVIGVMLLIVLLSVHAIDVSNFTGFDPTKVLVPYGVVLFAFAGSAAIPDLIVELRKNRRLLKKAILVGTLIPLVLYLLFATAIVGVTGSGTTEVATLGLGAVLGPMTLVLGNLFAAFVMLTTFMLLGLALIWMYQYDYRMKKIVAWALALSVPLFVVFSQVVGFIEILTITGAFAGGIEGILIVLAHRAAQKKSERKPEYTVKSSFLLSGVLILLYVIGMLYVFF